MRDITKGNIYKNFLVFAIPMVLAGLLSQMYSTIDTIIAGKLIGETGLSAIGASGPTLMLLSSLLWGAGIGFSIYIAERFGAKDYTAIKKEIFNFYITWSVFMLLLGTICFVLSKPIMRLISVDEAILDDAASYFGIYVFGLVLIVLTNNGVYIMNAFGISTFPFLMSVISAVINILGNIFAIEILNWGVAGVAAATVFSAAVVDICYIVKLFMCFKEMNVIKEKYQFEPKHIIANARYWVPTMLQQFGMYISGMLVSPMVNSLGSDASASYTVTTRISEFACSVYQNSSKTLSTYNAQCVGAGKYNEFKKGLKAGFVQALLFVLPIILAAAIFPTQLSYLFFPKDYVGKGVEYSAIFLRYFMPLLVANMIANLFHSFFRGVAAMKPLVVATFSGSFAKLLFCFVLMRFFGMYGFFAGWASSWLADGLIGYLFYRNGGWYETLMTRVKK